MPLRHSKNFTFIPRGTSDAVDGTPVPPGALYQLANLIPDPSTDGVFQPRPAANRLTSFGSFLDPGFISGRVVVGDIEYGMIASGLNPGFDQPYAYNLETNTFLTVGGITSANVPTSPPTSGEWTPPILAQVGSRVVVTHPGFDGVINKIGWFDVSGAAQTTIGDTVNGQPYIYGNPAVLGVQPGMTITGTGIPANTSVIGTLPDQNSAGFLGDVTSGSDIVSNLVGAYQYQVGMTIQGAGIPDGTTIAETLTGPSRIRLSVLATGTNVGTDIRVTGANFALWTGSTTAASATVTMTVTSGNMFVGQQISGLGIPLGATVTAWDGVNTVTMSAPALLTTTGILITITGGVIILSAAATATNDSVTFTIAGGTATAPLWGAGDTDRNPLVAQPVSVAQFNGRAYYAMGTATGGIQFSDSGFPCRISNSLAVQALVPNNGLPVTALGQLGLSAPLTGGIVAGLVAFQGVATAQQITGDQAFGNLSMQQLPGPQGTGTEAPLSICPTDKGMLYISPQGLRAVGFDGRVSPVIGDRGRGFAVPFIYAITPSRICAASNVDIYRVTVQRGDTVDQPTQEWWYDLARGAWSGPHSFPASLIEPWRNTFVTTPTGIPASLWQTDGYANLNSAYTENGMALTWTYQPSPLPDTNEMAMNSIVQMTLDCAQASLSPITAVAADMSGTFLDQTTVDVPAPPIWGEFNWGEALWGGSSTYQQLGVNWSKPLVFKQLNLSFTGTSNYNTKIGNVYIQYLILGYKLQRVG